MSGAGSLAPSKPVPMKLFATWEVDRTPSNCIPRLVSLIQLRTDTTLPRIDSDVNFEKIALRVRVNHHKQRNENHHIVNLVNGLLKGLCCNEDLSVHYELIVKCICTYIQLLYYLILATQFHYLFCKQENLFACCTTSLTATKRAGQIN